MVANDPARHRDFLKAYIGAGEVISGPAGVTARTENGDIEILEPPAARDLFAFPVKASGDGLTLNAMRFAVADLGQTEALHRKNGLAVRRHGGKADRCRRIEAFGATLIFEATN